MALKGFISTSEKHLRCGEPGLIALKCCKSQNGASLFDFCLEHATPLNGASLFDLCLPNAPLQ